MSCSANAFTVYPMKSISLGYLGDGPWAQNAFLQLTHDPSVHILFVIPRFENPDQILIEFANKAKIPLLTFANVNELASIEKISSFNPDLLVSMSFNQIIKPPLLNLPPLGFINCHAGRLPFYRGRNVLNWALINGESSFGITVHYLDEGIDTGDIILQEEIPITPEDDYGTVLAKAYQQCPLLLHRAIELIRDGKAKLTPQREIHPVGFYCGRRRKGDEEIDWTLTSVRIHNFIRGITLPGPCGRAQLNDQEVAIVKSKLIPQAPTYIGTPGEVVGRSLEGMIVKTGDATLLITQFAKVDSDGIPMQPTIPNFGIGERFKRRIQK